jgi:hypothetical protein
MNCRPWPNEGVRNTTRYAKSQNLCANLQKAEKIDPAPLPLFPHTISATTTTPPLKLALHPKPPNIRLHRAFHPIQIHKTLLSIQIPHHPLPIIHYARYVLV